MSRPDDQCTRCGKTGHRTSQCKQPAADARAHLGAKLRCTRCCKPGHAAEDCTSPVRPFLRMGVSNLQGIMDRCRVDVISGCWLWTMASTDGVPVVMLRDENDRPKYVTVMRAAWTLSGRKIPSGHVVYRAHCGDLRCVNPAHLACGTRAEMRSACAASGREKGAHRQAANRKRALEQAIQPEVCRRIEDMREAGRLLREITAETGVSIDTIRRVLKGNHPHSRSAIRSVPSSSVFAWRPA